MITSNVDSIISSLQNSSNATKTENSIESFISNLTTNKQGDNTSKTDALTFDNIKGITLEEIDTLFKDEDKAMAKNLRIATLFSNDDYLSKALFDTVLGQPFNLGFSYLSDRYEDKNVFLNSSSNDFSDLFHSSVVSRNTDTKLNSTDVISQDRLDEILTKVNSFNFLSVLTSTSKDKYDKYKDEDNEYSFLYNDFSLKYEELKYKYEELDNINKNIIKQF
ncbi:hypothetical protein AACT_1446 [Arcobacter acticola]|jgi:hypothetical protein|uniref:Uncharacterized protein n=1 Tax=Arcobacter acticola TaxID=1849015 RepID=A0A6M8ENH7_9BACT|nr:hypothetical protein [Arcobacter acticola]QKE28611.1 hypothetical protein AACT_1446 [Arcobacter acticola]